MADPFEEAAKKLREGRGQGGNADPFGAAAERLGIKPQKADLPKDAPRRSVDLGLSAIPYIAGAGAGALTGGMGWIPAGLAAAGAGGISAGVEQGLRKITGVNPSEHPLKEMGTAALEQGLYETGGRFVLGALERVFGSYVNSMKLYQSGLKPSGTSEIKASKSVGAGIREGIPLTEKATGIVRGRIDSLNGAIERTIQQSPADIPPSRYVANIESKLDALRKSWSKDATGGAHFVDQIDEAERQFLIDHGNVQPIQVQTQVPSSSGLTTPGGQPAMVTKTVTIKPEDMSLGELRRNARPLSTGDAQAIKKQTYETTRTRKMNAYDPGVHPGLAIRINKEIPRALKEELEQIYPQIKKLNAREGALIELEGQLQRFTKREMNKQTLPYIPFALAGAAAGGAHGEGHTMGALAGIMVRQMLEDPAIKSRVAIALDRASRIPGAGVAKYAGKQIPPVAIRGEEYIRQNPGLFQQ